MNADQTEALVPEESARLPSTRRVRTMIVDDDSISRELLAHLVDRIGHQAICAGSAEEALVKFDVFEPDIVLMDLMLPGIDGVEAMRRMKRAREQWLPVIVVSIKDTSAEVLAGLRAGADDYLTKPVSFEQLAAKLRNVAGSLSVHARLRTSLRFTQAVIEHIPEGLICLDDNGRILISNPAADRMFGFPPNELVGQAIEQIWDRGGSRSTLPRFGASKHSFGTGVRKDQTRFSCETQQTCVDVDGRSVCVVSVRDIEKRLGEERRMLNDAARLREYHELREAENTLAGEMLDRLLHRGKAVRNVRYEIEAATGFSGDVVAAVHSPTGKLFVMLADATGHGLSAAISLVPALSILHAMVDRGRSIGEIVLEMNEKLLELLPVGRFLAATIACLDESGRVGDVWVGGMPAVLQLDAFGRVVHRFESRHPPLGVIGSSPELSQSESFAWSGSAKLVFFSDGVLEAESVLGEQFGEARLLSAVAHGCSDPLACVSGALREHLGGLQGRDDASIAVVDLE